MLFISLRMTTKQEVFQLFYSVKQVSRSGGGTLHAKMTRNNVSSEDQFKMENSVKYNPDLLKYYIKLRDRNVNIAPPPKPK
jgi:hypothetical protein